MRSRIRVGIIGPGRIACKRHLPALSKIPGVELSIVWGPHVEKTRQIADQYGIPRVVEQWQDVAESSDVDMVVVATPPILHAEATIAALNAGKHVLCQSRMARTLQEALAMYQTAEGSGLVTSLYPPASGLKGDRVMRRLLHDEQYAGEIREVRVTGMDSAPPSEGYDWKTDPDMVGIQAMTLGLWAEVLHRWVGVPIRVVATGGAHGRRMTRGGEWVDAVVPDSLGVAADLECGATATYHFSSRAGLPSRHSIEVFGSRGTLIYRLREETMWGATEGDTEVHPIDIPPNEIRYQTTDAEFVQAVREGTSVSPSFAEGLQYMQFCEAVAISLATGQSVTVPPASPMMESWGCFLDSADMCEQTESSNTEGTLFLIS